MAPSRSTPPTPSARSWATIAATNRPSTGARPGALAICRIPADEHQICWRFPQLAWMPSASEMIVARHVLPPEVDGVPDNGVVCQRRPGMRLETAGLRPVSFLDGPRPAVPASPMRVRDDLKRRRPIRVAPLRQRRRARRRTHQPMRPVRIPRGARQHRARRDVNHRPRPHPRIPTSSIEQLALDYPLEHPAKHGAHRVHRLRSV